jgi:hypothetical protein
MLFMTMDENIIFAKLFRLTPFSHDVQSFIDFMAESGHVVTKSQINSWQRKQGNDKSRPVPDFVFEAMFDYFYKRREKIKSAFL